MLAVSVGGKHLVGGPGAGDDDGSAVDLGQLRHGRVGLDHPLGDLEHDGRLVPVGSAGVHLGPRLPVPEEQTQRQSSAKSGLARLARDSDERIAVLPLTIGSEGAEERVHDLPLPRLEVEVLAGPLTLHVGAVLLDPGRYLGAPLSRSPPSHCQPPGP